MRLLHNIKTYRTARKMGLSRRLIIRHIRQAGLLDGQDKLFLILALIGLIANILLIYVDANKQSLIQWQSQAIHWHKKAMVQESTIVSMLNGSVILNNRERTVCLLNAAGVCETNETK